MDTKRLISPGAESLLGVSFPVLDKGYLKLVDYAGCDNTVVAAARQSYDKGMDQDDMTGNERLINFLMREKHTSPFEQPMMVFEVKAPILVFREWHRHRTARLNEMSGRYTQLMREFYVPAAERVQEQSKANKQGSGTIMEAEFAANFRLNVNYACNNAFDQYEEWLEAGVAKELARIILPVNTYSKMVWQCDLSNLLHFLRLRMASTAQYEIRQYAELIGKAVETAFPTVWAAFEEYTLGAKTLSRSEVLVLADLFKELGSFGATPAMQKIIDKLGMAA
jgi:thymidylate synthase (FAD)